MVLIQDIYLTKKKTEHNVYFNVKKIYWRNA